MRKSKNTTIRKKATMQKSENTIYEMQIDDIFYVSYCRPSSVVFSLFRLENPKKRKTRVGDKSTLSSIRLFAF
jgi:hypothetical protein